MLSPENRELVAALERLETSLDDDFALWSSPMFDGPRAAAWNLRKAVRAHINAARSEAKPSGDMGAARSQPGAGAGTHIPRSPEDAEPSADVIRDMAGETVCGFRVAAWRETHPEHGDKYGHTYSEHWSTPSKHPAVVVERLFTEGQLREALSGRRPSDVCDPPDQHSDGWRDIGTAPKDGTVVLILAGGTVHQAIYDGPSDGAIYSGRPSVYNWFSESAGQTHNDREVTHWMPLPSLPAEIGASGADGQGPPVRRTPAPEAPNPPTTKEGEG